MRKRIPRLGPKYTEREAVELYKEDSTYPEIASETHKSATTIKEIIDSYEKTSGATGRK